MAGAPVLCCKSFSHRQQEIRLPSISTTYTPTPSWVSSSLQLVSLPKNLSAPGKHIRDDISRAVSLSWGSSFVSCRLRRSPAQNIISSRRKVSRIISDSRHERDQKDNEVKTFLYSLPRPETTVDMPENSPKAKAFWTWNLMKLFDRIADHADAQTEIGMKKRGAFYKAEDWFKHRSSKRHLRHILSTLKSRVIISLIPPVTALTSIAAVIAVYNTLVDNMVLPSFFPILHFSSLPYQLTAPALALLLVFRTEASYSRYDEGRKTWTKVFACTKDFSRQCLAWIQNPTDFHRRTDLQHYIMAFPVALKSYPLDPISNSLWAEGLHSCIWSVGKMLPECHLLDGSDIYEDLKLLLDEEDLAIVMNSQHRPNCLIQLMTQTLVLVQLSDNQRSLMEANITEFNHSVSVCERIIRTPIPLSYTRLTSRALILWHLTLPLVLWDDCKWMVVYATFFSASTLFCIEEVGVLIEEPFPMLSLDKMCAVAHQNVQELVEMARVTDKHLKTKEKKARNSAASGTGVFGRVPLNGMPQNPPK